MDVERLRKLASWGDPEAKRILERLHLRQNGKLAENLSLFLSPAQVRCLLLLNEYGGQMSGISLVTLLWKPAKPPRNYNKPFDGLVCKGLIKKFGAAWWSSDVALTEVGEMVAAHINDTIS